MPTSIDEYLSLKGAVELLCEISLNGSQYTELDEELAISHTTVGDRLDEGVEASLLTKELATGGHRTSHKYLLTPKGALIRWKLDTSGTTEAYYAFKNAQQRFNKKKGDIKEYFAENPESLENEELNRTVQFHRRYLRPDSTERPIDGDFDEGFRAQWNDDEE